MPVQASSAERPNDLRVGPGTWRPVALLGIASDTTQSRTGATP
jgi:hypothetical protein